MVLKPAGGSQAQHRVHHKARHKAKHNHQAKHKAKHRAKHKAKHNPHTVSGMQPWMGNAHTYECVAHACLDFVQMLMALIYRHCTRVARASAEERSLQQLEARPHHLPCVRTPCMDLLSCLHSCTLCTDHLLLVHTLCTDLFARGRQRSSNGARQSSPLPALDVLQQLHVVGAVVGRLPCGQKCTQGSLHSRPWWDLRELSYCSNACSCCCLQLVLQPVGVTDEQHAVQHPTCMDETQCGPQDWGSTDCKQCMTLAVSGACRVG